MTLVQVTDHVFERATSPLESNELIVTGFGYEKSTSLSIDKLSISNINWLWEDSFSIDK